MASDSLQVNVANVINVASVRNQGGDRSEQRWHGGLRIARVPCGWLLI